MTTYTTNLLVPHLDQNVAQPEIPVNESMDVFDSAISGQLTLDISGDIGYTLDDTSLTYPQEWQNGILIITNTGTANTASVDVLVPDGKKMKYTLVNDTGSAFDIQLKTTSGIGISVPDGSIYQMFSDGTNVRRIT